MREAIFYKDTVNNQDQFKVDYPYYGLFGSAVITPMYEKDEVIYKCRLLNGTTVFLKKLFQSKRWIDTLLNSETPLAATIGISIDDFLKIKKGA
jgi:hypothetical protein